MNSTSESLLLRLADHQDSQAWNRFVELYTPLIFYWSRRAGLQSSDASDLVQNVLAIVSRRIGQFVYDHNQSFRGWLRKVTINQFRLQCRHLKRDESLVRDSQLAAFPDPSTLESSWDQCYQVEIIRRAIAARRSDFSDKTWQALQDLLTSGEPAETVARRHRVSIWTLYSAKCRLIKRLKAELDGMFD